MYPIFAFVAKGVTYACTWIESKKLDFQGNLSVTGHQVCRFTCGEATFNICLPYLLHLLLLKKCFAAKEHLITQSDAWCIGTSQSCWVQDDIIHLLRAFKYLWNTLQHSIPVLLTHMTDYPFCGCSNSGQVCVRMHSCSCAWAGVCRVGWMPSLLTGSGIPALHSQHCHGSSELHPLFVQLVRHKDSNIHIFSFSGSSHFSVIFVNWTLAPHLLWKWWTEGQRDKKNCPRAHRSSMAKSWRHLSTLIIEVTCYLNGGCAQRHMECRAVETCTSYSTSTKQCIMLSPAHFPIWLQFVGSVWCPSWYTLVPEGFLSWAHSHVEAVAAALLPDEQTPLVLPNWTQLLFRCVMDRGAWLSLYLPLGNVLCVLCSLAVNVAFIWWEVYTRLCLP